MQPATSVPMDKIAARPDSIRASDSLELRFRTVRQTTRWITQEVTPEDSTVQSMADASPIKWHLAHTTWFFETFVLERYQPNFKPYLPEFRVLFNSYYNGVGEQHARPERGLITRPGLDEVWHYRGQVEQAVLKLLPNADAELQRLIEIGLHHEQQHQELMVMDFKHLLSRNPLHPVWKEAPEQNGAAARPLGWKLFEGGLVSIGHDGEGFHFDNEGPRHQVLLQPFKIADRPTTVGEYLRFVEDGGYSDPEWWLADGWECVQHNDWNAPLYWMRAQGRWQMFTTAGVRELNLDEPVCHVSYFEALAFANWSKARLATEAEWEHAAGPCVEGNDLTSGILHPAVTQGDQRAFYGDVWEWTQSAYGAYPGFKPLAGALGEYNGKFMCNQFVLRGGCCATPQAHNRRTYRNFYYPHMRWMFSGIRLAKDL